MNLEEQKELEYLNNEILMRMKKGYSDGALLVSFSLIYFATIIGTLISLVDYSNPELMRIFEFGAVSILAFFSPILIYYSSDTRNRENISGILNIAAFKKKYYENNTFSNGHVSGGRWEKFHKITLSSFFDKGHNEVFFLAALSLALYLGSFFLTGSFTWKYLVDNESKSFYSLTLLIIINLLYVICLFPAVRRIIKLHSLNGANGIMSEIQSEELFYNIQYELTKNANDEDELKELITKLHDENRKISSFVIKTKIPSNNVILLEKLFYSEAFPNINIISPDEKDEARTILSKIMKKDASVIDEEGLYSFITNITKE